MSKRWYVVEDGRAVYSCAERNFQKAENFCLDYTNDGRIVLVESIDEAAAKASQHPAEPDTGDQPQKSDNNNSGAG